MNNGGYYTAAKKGKEAVTLTILLYSGSCICPKKKPSHSDGFSKEKT